MIGIGWVVYHIREFLVLILLFEKFSKKKILSVEKKLPEIFDF